MPGSMTVPSQPCFCRCCAGQHNTQQRIQYHKKVKDENNALKEELSKLRIDLNIVSVRYERAKGELARFRTAAGQVGSRCAEVGQGVA